MGFLKSALKAGIATKAIAFARKPENQAKARQMLAQAKAKRSGRTTPRV